MAKKVTALDTNIIADLLSGKLQEIGDDIFVPFVVQAEVYYGVATGNNPKKYKSLIDDFFNDDTITLSDGLGRKTIDCYVEIASYLKIIGRPISPNDLWIAAECMSLSLPLMTMDKDFDNVPQIIKA